jgi:hypothetical protein
MTFQNSLERTLAAISETVRNAAANAVVDNYVAAQLAAAAELIDNLATRVEWRRELLAETIGRARIVVDAGVAAAASESLPLSRGLGALDLLSTDLLPARDAHVAAVSEIAEWLGATAGHDAARAELMRFLVWQLAEERSLTIAGTEGGTKR